MLIVIGRSRTGPATGNVDPLGQAAALLALDVDNVRVAAAATPDTVLLGRVKVVPVSVLLDALAVVERRLLEPGLAGQLARWGVGWAMLDRRMAIAKVAEIVDVTGPEEGAGGEGVDGSISPLSYALARGRSRGGKQNVHAPSRIHRCDPSSGKTPRTRGFGRS